MMRSLALRFFYNERTFCMIREIRSELFTDAAYEIYSACMYLPTPQKYRALTDEYLSDPDVYCFGAFEDGNMNGILIVRRGKVLGIAVHPDKRIQGVGRALIQHALLFFPILCAETDSDAVTFYRRCGFECTSFERTFPDGSRIRYACEKHA